ncbi:PLASMODESMATA CALLOSE-BINDING PROTEIN 3-like [Momordica charantia]|uniref:PLASMODESMATA CALLOSE-BINDING PROTEIN 3-like n=1 Tax=Momordica charantia TaxID=3673 RepID=A0A6J1BPT8_MOMCH|nr:PLASMODESMATA CALLOSE-BINDING PROTEIN 3-like [Momordica charantia]
MAIILLCYLLFMAFTGHSSATYCVCKDGQSDQALQKSLDYACGAGADCTPILQNGPCFQPNTVKDHCSYAVNSYFQRKGQVQGSCDFSGTATPSPSPPAGASGCVYPSSPSGTGTPTTTPTSTTPATTMPGTTPGTTTNPSTTPPSTMTPGTTSPSVFGSGISPTGGVGSSGNSIDGSAAAALTAAASNFLFFTATVAFWLSLFF